MGKRRPQDLPETGRLYVDRTRGGWLASPGIERHVVARRRVPVAPILVVLLVVLALIAYWRS